MKYCPYCGKPQNDAAKFCTECGVNFETGPVTASNAAPAQPTQQAAEASAVSAAAPILETAAPENKVGKKTKLFIWLGAALAVLAVGVVVFMSTYMSTSNRFSRALESGNYQLAGELYYNKISGNAESTEKAKNEMIGVINSIKEDFVNEAISYQEATDKLNNLAAISLADMEKYNAYLDIEAINVSKNEYSNAVAAYNSGAYDEAIVYAGGVIEKDTKNYDAAQQLITDAVTARAEEVLRVASEHAADGNFGYAIETVNNAIITYGSDDRFMNALADYKKSEITAAMTLARTAFEEGRYADALTEAKKGIYYVPESVELQDAVAAFSTYVPVKLTEFEIFNYSRSGDVYNGYYYDKFLEDNYSNVYDSSFYATGGTVTLLLNYKYTSFGGYVACPKGLKSDSFRKSATVEIFGDGQLLYSSGPVSSLSSVQSFELDVSGYERLEITWTTEGMNIWSNWGKFATIFNGQFNQVKIEPNLDF